MSLSFVFVLVSYYVGGLAFSGLFLFLASIFLLSLAIMVHSSRNARTPRER